MGKRKPEGLADLAKQAGRPLNAAIYDRVSFDKRGDRRSVGEQKDANVAACEEHGWRWSEASIYTDNDRSASRFATKPRPAWQRVLKDLEQSRYEVLVLWEPARGSRELIGWITFLDMCRDAGILIHITAHGHTYDVRKRRDYKTLAEEGLDSADESEKAASRVHRSMEALALKGLPHGRLLYGYRREYTVDDRGRKHLVGQYADEIPRTTVTRDGEKITFSHAGVVREIIERMAKGDTARNIARSLNERRIPTPGDGQRWEARIITRLAVNPAYAGLRVWKGEVVGAASWDALVAEASHYTVVSRLEDSSRKWDRDTSLKYLGSGLFVCGLCGSPVRPIQRYWGMAYTCTPRVPWDEKKITGRHVVRSIEDVDKYVQRAVWLRILRPDLVELLAQDDDADKQGAYLADQIAERKRRLDEASDAYARGELSISRLSRIEATLEPEIEQLRDQMVKFRVGPVLDGLVLPTLEQVEAEWWSRPLVQRREVIRVLIERVEILKVGKGRRHYTPEESVRIVWRQPNTAGGGSSASPVEPG
jgi:DNA invertase Pin-like site-specific DNA recombinase